MSDASLLSRRPERISWLLGGLAIAVVFALLALGAVLDRKHALSRAETQVAVMANFLSTIVEQQLVGIHSLFTGMENFLSAVPNSKRRFHPRVRAALLDYKRRYPQLMDLLVLDRHGVILNWTGPGIPPDIRDRAYVKAFTEKSRSDIFIGEPKLSRVHAGKWFFGVSKPIRGITGELQGILVAIMDIEFLHKTFFQLPVEQRGTLVLISDTGRIYTRIPGHSAFVGEQVDGLDDLEDATEEARLSARTSPLDGTMRLFGYRRVGRHSLIAFVTVSKDDVLAEWQFKIRVAMGSAIALSLLLLLVTRSLSRIVKAQAEQRDVLQRMATTDGLTNLYNRRHILTLIHEEMARYRRYGHPFSVIQLDIDFFSNVNEIYGHDEGDRLLIDVADYLKNTCRKTDRVARFGGEEFLILLPETNMEGGREAAEKLRRNFVTLSAGDGRAVTASFGVCGASGEQEVDDILRRTQHALDHAKECGRDRVISCLDDGDACSSIE